MNNNELYHYGVLGMKWGRRKANSYGKKIQKKSKRLNKINRYITDQENTSELFKAQAKIISRQAAKKGPMEWAKQYNKIHALEKNSKQYDKYAAFGRKVASKYMNKLSKDYTVVYDVVGNSYSLRDKKSS